MTGTVVIICQNSCKWQQNIVAAVLIPFESVLVVPACQILQGMNDDIKAAKLGHEYNTLTLISVWYTAYLVKDFLLMTKAKILVTVVY